MHRMFNGAAAWMERCCKRLASMVVLPVRASERLYPLDDVDGKCSGRRLKARRTEESLSRAGKGCQRGSKDVLWRKACRAPGQARCTRQAASGHRVDFWRCFALAMLPLRRPRRG